MVTVRTRIKRDEECAQAHASWLFLAAKP